MQYAPIALFTYNRPDKTKTVIKSLLQNAEAKDSELFIFSDGPKNEKAAEGVRANREFLKEFKSSEKQKFKSIEIIEREKNWGLANSLIAGITDICEKYGKVVVVEDDLILSPYFLKFMNDGLNKYENDNRVSAISGFVHPVDFNLPNNFFLRFFTCWGWATWNRAWQRFIPDPKYLMKALIKTFKVNEFNLDNSVGFYDLLCCQYRGEVNSWAIRMYASSFINNQLVLYPGKSLVKQNGIDGTGTHASNNDNLYVDLSSSVINIQNIAVEESVEAYKSYSLCFHKRGCTINRTNIIKSFIKRIIGYDLIH